MTLCGTVREAVINVIAFDVQLFDADKLQLLKTYRTERPVNSASISPLRDHVSYTPSPCVFKWYIYPPWLLGCTGWRSGSHGSDDDHHQSRQVRCSFLPSCLWGGNWPGQRSLWPHQQLSLPPGWEKVSPQYTNTNLSCDMWCISVCFLVIAVVERMVTYEYTLLIQRTLTLSLNSNMAPHVIIIIDYNHYCSSVYNVF